MLRSIPHLARRIKLIDHIQDGRCLRWANRCLAFSGPHEIDLSVHFGRLRASNPPLPHLLSCAHRRVACASAHGNLPVQAPQLRIEAGMHIGPINAMDVSSDGKLTVTSADDKRVRLWSLPDGRPIKTFRLPSASNRAGRTTCAALSPDGRYVAIGVSERFI
jgi:WD40 repeat protein